MKRIAVFPGSFDPITRGHEDIVRRAISLFDIIIVALGENQAKSSFFPAEARLRWIREIFSDDRRIEAQAYTGLTVDFCKKTGARYILRGLRTAADFEFERSIGQVNKQISPATETIFLLSRPEFSAINASIVRDIIRHGGDPSPFIPAGLILK